MRVEIVAKTSEGLLQELRIIMVVSFDELVHDVMAQDGRLQQFCSSELIHRYPRSGPDGGEGILHLCCMGFKVAHVVEFFC